MFSRDSMITSVMSTALIFKCYEFFTEVTFTIYKANADGQMLCIVAAQYLAVFTSEIIPDRIMS
jgi:hypothetical protein